MSFSGTPLGCSEASGVHFTPSFHRLGNVQLAGGLLAAAAIGKRHLSTFLSPKDL